MISKAILMAGGRGSRLKPLTDSCPKPLLPVDNIPILSRILRRLEKAGIREAVITTGYLGEQIEAHYGKFFRSIRLRYAREDTPLGTAGGVRQAASFFSLAPDEDFLVASGDALFTFDLADFHTFHKKSGALLTMAAKAVEDVTGYGVILGKGGRIAGFAEKPDPALTPSHLVNAGVYLLTPQALSYIPASGPYDFGRELFPRLLALGEAIGYYPFDSYWCDIGTPAAYLACNLKVSGGASPVGNGCRVAPGARILSSVVMDNCVIPAGCTLDHAVVGRGVILSPGVILPPGTVIPAGARLEKSPLPLSPR